MGLSTDGLALLALAGRSGAVGLWAAIAALADLDEDVRAARVRPRSGTQPPDADLLARLGADDMRALGAFAARFAAERAGVSRRAIPELIGRAVNQSGYADRLREHEWGERRLANVHKLMRVARSFEASEGRDLRGFLDHVAYRRRSRAGSEPDAPASGFGADAVRLMTVHAAKGLEFPVVCVADLGRGKKADPPHLLLDGERIGLRLRRLDGSKAVPTLDYEALRTEQLQAQMAEEERIIYVAMTRARERLLLSGAVDFAKWPQPGERAPAIAWLGPALSDEFARVTADDPGRDDFDLAVGTGGDALVRVRLNTAEGLAAAPGGMPEELPRARAREAVESSEGAPDGQLSLLAPLDTSKEPARARAREGPDDAPPDTSKEPARARVWEGVADTTADVARGTREGARMGGSGFESLSYTALSDLRSCGYRYYLQRVLGLPEDRSAAAGMRGGGEGSAFAGGEGSTAGSGGYSYTGSSRSSTFATRAPRQPRVSGAPRARWVCGWGAPSRRRSRRCWGVSPWGCRTVSSRPCAWLARGASSASTPSPSRSGPTGRC